MRFLPAVEMTGVSRENMGGGCGGGEAAAATSPHAINSMESFRPQGEISSF